MNMKSNRLLFILIFFNLFLVGVYSQESVTISYNGNRNYVFTERTDLRRYDNGKYVGLLSREVSSFISPKKKDGYYLYTGNFYVMEKTQRASMLVNNGLNDSIDSAFTISDDGKFEMVEDNGFPSFRSFPSYASAEIHIGDSWKAAGQRVVDPLEKGIYTKLPILVQYTYVGDRYFHDEDCYELSAQWATRYGNGFGSGYFDYEGDPQLQRATGSHSAKIYVSKESGNALLVSDSVNESFVYKDGKEVTLKGTISLFTEYPPSVNEELLEPIITALKTKDQNINFEKTDLGTRLSIHDLQFQPNTAELLPGEAARIDNIAALLKKVPEKTRFLIEGHTARVGEEKGEYELSLERAHAIAKALTQRGISSQRIICKGYGGRIPIGNNDTPEGRAINRRVEITILE